MNLTDLLKNKPYLSWDIKDKDELSEQSAFEHILNYGNWEDYLLAEKYLGVEKAATLFNNLKNQPRKNLRIKTINYFEKYFQKYA